MIDGWPFYYAQELVVGNPPKQRGYLHPVDRQGQDCPGAKLEKLCRLREIVSHSAHIYSDKWNATQELLGKYYPQHLAWQDDPRGNFHISVEKGRIVAEHATTQGGKTGIVFEGKSARALYGEIINHQMISLLEHAAYLGMELYKAEIALRTGAEYNQDKDLKLPVPEALKAPRLNDRKG